ncbi:hypothetical protein ACFWUW_14195 [Streptomyces sp. NPDC058655]|uniref:hypothetical protein n=1 Tax=unclassified Streptomyces TaxID=2593676 RepID=UPI0036656A8B
MRTTVVLLLSWAALTGVERWGEDASWRAALFSGLLWAAVVTGAWWFAEWTQIRPRGTRHARGTGTAARPYTAVAEDDHALSDRQSAP